MSKTSLENEIQVFGMKWFNFFIKVRPWVAIIFYSLSLFIWIFALFEALTAAFNILTMAIVVISMLVLILLDVTYIVYNVKLYKKAKSLIEIGDVKKYLLYESFYTVFISVMYQYGSDEGLFSGFGWIFMLAIDILIVYFLWYKWNMNYFQIRLSNCKNISNQEVKSIENISSNQTYDVCLTRMDEESKTRRTFESQPRIWKVQKLPHDFVHSALPISQSKEREFNAIDVAKELSEKCAKTIIQINRKCNEIGIDYSERKLAVATFAYFFTKWAYTNKNITFAQVGEVQNLYKEQFSEFNKVAFQDDSFKNVMENEQIFAETLDKFLNYAKDFYNSENNSFSKKLLEKYILEFIKNESDIVTLKEFL